MKNECCKKRGLGFGWVIVAGMLYATGITVWIAVALP